MWHTLFGTFRWAAVLGVLIGLAGGYFLWERKERIARVDREGVETVAVLIQIRQQTSGRSRRTSYWADIRWRDRSGVERRREKIPVSGTFARRVIKSTFPRRVTEDGRLVLRTTRIKYLPDSPEVRPLLLEDGMHNSWKIPALMWGFLAFAVFWAGLWVHMLRYERRAEQRRAAPAAT